MTLLATLCFTAAPSLFITHDAHWRGYEEKYRAPLTPMTINSQDGEEHVAKLNLRLTVPFIAYIGGFGKVGTYLLLGLCALLVCVITPVLMLRAVGGDKELAFWLSMAVAGGHLLTLYFRPLTGYFDGVAITLVMVCFLLRSRVGQMVVAVLALFADERSLFGLALVPLFHVVTEENASNTLLKSISKAALPISGAFVVWIALRFAVTAVFGLHPHLGGVGLGIAASNYNYLPSAIWAVFQGGWGLVLGGLVLLLARGHVLAVTLAVGVCLLLVAGTAVVFDLTRSATYIFPLIFVAAVGFREPVKRTACVVVAATCATLALFEPNIDIISSGENSEAIVVWSKPVWITLPADVWSLWKSL